MSKVRWLDRRIAAPGPYLTLCLAEPEFHAALRSIKFKGHTPNWVTPGANATCHHLYNDDGDVTSVVCLSGWEGRNPIEVAGLLIHEAVHVWQEYCDKIGEKAPGREQEAYAIQAVAQELMAEFSRRTQRA